MQLEVIEGLLRDQVDAWWRCEKITGVLQIGNVDLMLEGIEEALRVRVNRVAPELVSLTPGAIRKETVA